MDNIKGVDTKHLVYVDESGVDSFFHNPYGWASRGKKVYGDVPGKRYARESFVAGLCNGKVLAPFCYEGTCHTELFNFWVEKFLVQELEAGQVIIMDNAAFHKSEKTRELIEQAGCKLVFLPPYSPDLNPIETFWANLKYKIKTCLRQGEKTLQYAIDNAFQEYHKIPI